MRAAEPAQSRTEGWARITVFICLRSLRRREALTLQYAKILRADLSERGMQRGGEPMAQRRMLTLEIVNSDSFLDLPATAQCLYFHLVLRADDDGFMNSPRMVQRMIGATDDDLQNLIKAQFLLAFADGVVVIRHWKMHNYVKPDRYRATQYQEHLSKLRLQGDSTYILADSGPEP